MRKNIFRSVGEFAGIGVAEDREWGLRANAAGYRISYVEGMIVYHPARKTFAELVQKWNRHIAHDYEERKPGPKGLAIWYAKAIAIAGSPLYEVFTIIRSPRISGVKQRLLAFACLVRIRLYRTYAMIKTAIGKKDGPGSDWSRS